MNENEIKKLGIYNTISGIALSSPEGECFIVKLPDEEITSNDIKVIRPDINTWHKILFQLDNVEVSGIRKGQNVILRKSQRNIESIVSWQVYRRDNYKCRYCGVDNVPLTVDHIITWESEGESHPDNLVSCCRKCNRIRGNTPYEEWIKSDYYKTVSGSLTEDIKKLNLELIDKLDTLPRVGRKRKR